MIESLKSMFEAQDKTERYQVSQALLSCKLKYDDPLSPHVIKMVGYVQSLERLGYPIIEEFATDIILKSLPSFHQIPLNPSDQIKTVFITPYGAYCYRTMPFGLQCRSHVPNMHAKMSARPNW